MTILKLKDEIFEVIESKKIIAKLEYFDNPLTFLATVKEIVINPNNKLSPEALQEFAEISAMLFYQQLK